MEDAIIIDLGSEFIKGGALSDSFPSVIIPSLVGRPRRRYVHLFEGEPAFVGEEAIKHRNQLSFTYPIDHGHVDDWLEMEELFSTIINRELNVDLSNRPVLVTEPPLASQYHREKLGELMFDVFDAKEFNISIQAILSLYSTGRTTGLVVEIGGGVSQVVCVFEGYTSRPCVRRSDFGGQELTMFLQKMLCDAGYSMTCRDDYENVRLMKECLCYVALDPAEEIEKPDNELSYKLPDGMTLRDGVTNRLVVNKERFYCPEALFDPQLFKYDNPALPELVWQTVQASPLESRKQILGSVILAGGSTMFPGLVERLTQDLKYIAPPQARPFVKVHAAEDRLFAAWFGAKIFCDPEMRSMQEHLWTNKVEWQEAGPSVIHRKTAQRASP